MSKRRDGDGDNPNLDSPSEETQKKKQKTLLGYFTSKNGKSIVVNIDCVMCIHLSQ